MLTLSVDFAQSVHNNVVTNKFLFTISQEIILFIYVKLFPLTVSEINLKKDNEHIGRGLVVSLQPPDTLNVLKTIQADAMQCTAFNSSFYREHFFQWTCKTFHCCLP